MSFSVLPFFEEIEPQVLLDLKTRVDLLFTTEPLLLLPPPHTHLLDRYFKYDIDVDFVI